MKKPLLSFVAKALFAIAFVLITPNLSAQIFQFTFENTTAVTTDNAVGTPSFTSNGLGAGTGYSTTTPCQGARMYTGNNWDTGDYYQFTVNTTGYGNMSLSLCDRTDNTAVGTFIIRVSSDGGTNWTTVLNTFTPATTNTTSRTTGTFPTSANNQDEVLIQIYKTNSPANARTYLIDTVTLTGSPIPTVTSFTPTTACIGSTFTITGTNFTAATAVQINGTAVASYTVNSATSITATIASGNTSGLVTVSNANGSGSSATNLTVNPVPTGVTATASSANICLGGTINLAATATSNSSLAHTAFSENFNAATNSWTRTNTSAGGTPANAAWTLRANGYTYDTDTFSSNDASQFYMSNSDAQGNATGVATTTTLTSPAFSTVGMSSANLNFYHYFRNVSTDAGRVFMSTNGSTWTQVAIYSNTASGGTGSVGAANNFSLATISLAAYLNQATVYIRFQYTATYDWYWAIDNVSVTGNLTTAPAATYAWTSVPAGFTSSLQSPTGVAPTVNTVYTVTATNSYGCTTSASTVTVVVDPTSVGGTVSNSVNACSGSNSGTLLLSGRVGNVVRWESSLDNFATAGTPIVNTNSSLNYSNLTQTTSYRAVVQSGTCPTANSTSATITIDPTTVPGSVTSNATVCSGSNSGTLNLGAHTGNVIRWESSLDNFATAGTPIVNTTNSQSYSNLTVTTSYRAVVQSGSCPALNSISATITVNPVSVGGAVNTSATVCSGTNSGTLNLTGHTGSIIRWESSLDGFATAGTPIVNTTTSQSYSNITSTTSYRAVVQSGVCTTANSTAATITVSPVSVGGAVSTSATVCSGSNSGTLNLTGHTGNVIRWESSLDGFATAGTPIVNTTTSQSYSNITATTSYRAVVQSGSCTSANSTFATITVTPVSVGGAVNTSATVCSGSNSGTLSLTGHTGSVIRWESSLDGFATAGTPIVNTTTSQAYSNITATTSYRAVVQSGSCTSANSTFATIAVTPVSVGGAVNTSATVCSGSNSGTLNLTGHTGSVIRWESSLDGFATAGTPIVNTTTSQSYSNITSTTSYRAVVQSGVCATANSTAATITVSPVSVGGAVSTSATVCSGSNSGTLNLTGHTGNVIRWESSLDGFSTAGTPIVNTTTSQSYSNITATTSYRAVVQSGSCTSANSTLATITVDAVSVGGTVAGSTTVCASANSGDLTLSGYTGTITKWQSSDVSDFSVGVLDIPNTTAILSYLNVGTTTYYRAVVTSGVCSLAYSTVASVTVDAASVGGTVNGDATVCYGNNSGSLTLSGQSGTIIGWESSLNNFATAGMPINNTTTSQSYSNLTGTTYYRAIIGGGACGTVYSSVGVITININTVWTGATSTSWNDATNWSCGVVPTSDVNVSITAVTNQPIIGADAFARTLTMDAATTLTVQSGFDFRIVDAITGLGNAVITVESNANLIQEVDVNNSGNAIVKRAGNALMRLDYVLWSSPVTGSQTLLNFSPLTTANRFYVYNPSSDTYNSVTPSTTTFNEGKGYLIRMPNTHPTTPTVWNGQFNGTLNNGDVNISVTNNTYNAIGNPYPSTIDADMFITQNGINEALYFWRKTNNDLTTSYATYTLAGGAGTSANAGGDPNGLVPNGIIQVGQGFIAKSTSTNFNFNNGMRLGNNANQFFRTNEIERNRIWLNLTNADGVFSQTMLAYMTGATYGIDAAIDGPYFNDSQLALTSIIDNNEYAVQGRSLPFDNTDVVPLGFKAITAGTYTIGIDHTDGLFANVAQDIFIKDNLDNSYHNLRISDYSFASEAGVFNGRFEVVYAANVLATDNLVWDASQVVIFKQGNDLVVNTGKVNMSKVKVYDVRGRLFAEKENINASETKLFVGTTNQVLIVKVTSVDNREITKKVLN